MDPKRRITSIEALEETYLQEAPEILADAFNCFGTDIPFPIRKNLSPKKPKDPAPTVACVNRTEANKSLGMNRTVTQMPQMNTVHREMPSRPMYNIDFIKSIL